MFLSWVGETKVVPTPPSIGRGEASIVLIV